jgi:cytochrome bd ubiquinol oxidase subunit II
MQFELLLGIIMMGSLTIYVLLAGADYGGGLWDLLSFGQRTEEQRNLIVNAITPVWEANHVWLILVVVLLFSGFPPAFAAITTALHVPLLILLLGIVFRGTSFTFRAYNAGNYRAQRYWGFVFSIASIVAPLFLGIVVGAISNGRVLVLNGISQQGFIAPWFSPFPVAVGIFALALFAYLAAAYLAVEASNKSLQEDFRTRALLTGALVAICALSTFLLSSKEASNIQVGLLSRPWSWGEQIATASAAIVAFAALWRRRYRVARLAVAVQVSCILWGWALAQYPFLVRPNLTLFNSSAPAVVLKDLIWACLAGAVVLFPSLLYLFRVFKSDRGDQAIEH